MEDLYWQGRLTLEIWLEDQATRRKLSRLKKLAADRDDVFGTVIPAGHRVKQSWSTRRRWAMSNADVAG